MHGSYLMEAWQNVQYSVQYQYKYDLILILNIDYDVYMIK